MNKYHEQTDKRNMSIKGIDGEGLEDEELDIGKWKKGILVI